MSNYNIAVLIPCLNEEATLAQMIREFRQVLPEAEIFVYDNNSSDKTPQIAQQEGAILRYEMRQGKGNVVRRMFEDIEADIYLLIDGDGTYDVASSRKLIDHLIDNNLDMVVGNREASDSEKTAYSFGHKFGNRVFTKMVNRIFDSELEDILSGYRVFSRRFIKSFPVMSSGFEIETEITMHALDLKLPIAEIATKYKPRPENSNSKLRTIPDGIIILNAIVTILYKIKPFTFFAVIFLLLNILSLVLSFPLITEFIETGLVPRIPTAILVVGLQVLSVVCLCCGLILHVVSSSRKEMKLLHFLNISRK